MSTNSIESPATENMPDSDGSRVDRGLERHRAHPRLVHVAQLRAGGGADAHEVALVGDRRAAAVDRRGEEVRAQLGVVREAAGGEDHRLARGHAHGLAVGRWSPRRRPPRRPRSTSRCTRCDDADVDAVALGRRAHRAGCRPGRRRTSSPARPRARARARSAPCPRAARTSSPAPPRTSGRGARRARPAARRRARRSRRSRGSARTPTRSARASGSTGRTAAGARAAPCSAGSPPRGPRSRPPASGGCSGTQYQNAAFLAVPPSSGAFSSRITSSPSQRANSAAGSPPPPPPTTTTSAVASNAPAPAGAADSRSNHRSLLPPVPTRPAGSPSPARAPPSGPPRPPRARHATCASGRTSTQPDSSTSRARAQSS